MTFKPIWSFYLEIKGLKMKLILRVNQMLLLYVTLLLLKKIRNKIMNQNANEFPSYEDYLSLCNQHNVEEERVMSREEYENDFSVIAKQIRETKLNFIPSLPGTRKVSVNVNQAIGAFTSAIGLAATIAGKPNEFKEGISAAANATKSVFEEISKATGGTIKPEPFSDDGGQGPKGPGGAGGGGTKSNPFDVQRLNYNTKPVEIRWNTNIKPNTYSSVYLDANSVRFPLHLTCARFLFTKNDAKINRYMESFITLAYSSALQKAVSFNINTKILTSENLINSLNAIASSLQVYYWLASILSYSDGLHNRNEGMLYLRSIISAEELNDIYILQRMLINIPIPPKLMELMFYINQNFKSSSLPGSSIIKICPVNFIIQNQSNHTIKYLPKDVVGDCIEALSTPINKEIYSMFSRACPSWVNDSLFSCPPIPVHDPQFTTLFANLPYQYSCKEHNFTGPGLYDELDDKKHIINSYYLYNSYADILDGGIFGLFTGWDHTKKSWLPGLMLPAVENLGSDPAKPVFFNRFSYFADEDWNVPELFPVYGIHKVNSSRGETYVYGIEVDCESAGCQRFGTEVCLNVTSETVRESSFALIEWLLSIEDIGRNSGSNDVRGSKSSPRRRRPNKNKFKGKK